MKKINLILFLTIFQLKTFALNFDKEVTVRNLTVEDKNVVIDQFVKSFLNSYKSMTLVITHNQEPTIVTETDLKLKTQWLTETAHEVFNEYVIEKKPNQRAIGILLNSKLIGALFYDIVDKDTIYLSQYSIIPEMKRKGIGIYVINTILPKLHPECTTYDVLLRHQNGPAMLFYKKLGFKIGSIDIVHKYGYDPLRYMSMYKTL